MKTNINWLLLERIKRTAASVKDEKQETVARKFCELCIKRMDKSYVHLIEDFWNRGSMKSRYLRSKDSGRYRAGFDLRLNNDYAKQLNSYMWLAVHPSSYYSRYCNCNQTNLGGRNVF